MSLYHHPDHINHHLDYINHHLDYINYHLDYINYHDGKAHPCAIPTAKLQKKQIIIYFKYVKKLRKRLRKRNIHKIKYLQKKE